MYTDTLYFFTAICDILTVPDNGVISYSPDTTPRLDGAVATYSCDEGYRVSSGPDRDCGTSGEWSGMSITCPSEFNNYDNLR